MDGTNFNNEEFIKETEEEKKITNVNIESLSEKETTMPYKEEKLKRHTVKFSPIIDFEDYFDDLSQSPLIAYDKDGNFFDESEEIKEGLKKDGAMLFVFKMDDGLPIAYENRKGKIFVSDEPISATAQLPGSKFEPMKSALPEDIEEGLDAGKLNKIEDEIKDHDTILNDQTQKTLAARYSQGLRDVKEEIRKLESGLKKLPEEPKEPDKGKIHPKPDYVPKKVPVPKKPETPVAPIKPKKPVKPEPPTPPFEMKKLKHLQKPDKPKKSDYIRDIGQPPKYSKAAQFFSRLFRRTDSDDYKKFIIYKGELVKNEEGLKRYEEDFAKYKNQVQQYKKREQEIREYNEMLEANKDKFEAYNKQVDEYAVEADKYLAELEKYNKEYAEYEKKAEVFKEELEVYQNTSFADYMKAMEQYQIDSKKESMLSKKYGADLVLYESDMKRYEKELEEYKVKKAEYDKTIEEFTKKYGTPEEARKKLAELKQREKDLNEDKESEKARYDKAKGEADKYKEKKVKLQTEKDKNLENYKKINSYRNHTEVLLEGISSVIKNGKVTRDNLFANTWLNKNACKGKKLNNEEAKEALYNYLACKKAERQIATSTKNYMISNPAAENTVIRNLNDDTYSLELKNDRKFQEILRQWGDKPINPDTIANYYFSPNTDITFLRPVQMREFKEMKDYLQASFGEKAIGQKDIGEEAFNAFLKYKVLERAEYVNNTNQKPMKNGDMLALQSYIYGEGGTRAVEHDFKKRMEEIRPQYQEAYNEFLKNQKDKEAAVKDLPEGSQRLLNLKTEYNFKEFSEAIKNTKERLVKEGKIDMDGKRLAPKKDPNVNSESENVIHEEKKPKGMKL